MANGAHVAAKRACMPLQYGMKALVGKGQNVSAPSTAIHDECYCRRKHTAGTKITSGEGQSYSFR